MILNFLSILFSFLRPIGHTIPENTDLISLDGLPYTHDTFIKWVLESIKADQEMLCGSYSFYLTFFILFAFFRLSKTVIIFGYRPQASLASKILSCIIALFSLFASKSEEQTIAKAIRNRCSQYQSTPIPTTNDLLASASWARPRKQIMKNIYYKLRCQKRKTDIISIIAASSTASAASSSAANYADIVAAAKPGSAAASIAKAASNKASLAATAAASTFDIVGATAAAFKANTAAITAFDAAIKAALSSSLSSLPSSSSSLSSLLPSSSSSSSSLNLSSSVAPSKEVRTSKKARPVSVAPLLKVSALMKGKSIDIAPSAGGRALVDDNKPRIQHMKIVLRRRPALTDVVTDPDTD